MNEEQKYKKINGFSKISLDCVIDCMEFLDEFDLASCRISNKIIFKKAGDLVARAIFLYLRKKYFFSNFVKFTKNNLISHNEIIKLMNEPINEILIMSNKHLTGKTILNPDCFLKFIIYDKIGTENDENLFITIKDDLFEHLHDKKNNFIYDQKEIMRFIFLKIDNLVPGLYSPAKILLENKKKIFIIGGFNIKDGIHIPSDIVYEFDENLNKKIHESKLNSPRQWASVIEFEDKLYLCGGYSPNGNCVEVFDYSTGSWEIEQEKMVKTRSDFLLCEYNSEIYAVGGNCEHFSIEKKNRITQKWEIVTEIEDPRISASSILIDDRMFVFGGCFTEEINNYDFYNFKTGLWASKNKTSKFFKKNYRSFSKRIYSSNIILNNLHKSSKNWTCLTKNYYK